MRSLGILAAIAALLVSAPVAADDVKVGIGISGWTGFAPLTLANQAGIFKKNGLDVTIKKIPQKDRHLAVASGDVQCAATTVETWISWNANGVATKQIFQLDKSFGRWHGNAKRCRLDQGSEGQDDRRLRTRHRPLFHPGVDAQEKRPLGQGRYSGESGAGRGRASIRVRSERCSHDL